MNPHPTPIRVALLGCGTVGREVAHQIVDGQWDLELVSVLVRDSSKDRGIDPELITDRFDDVLAARPDVIVELIGGLEPAGAYVKCALSRGISVVTANKTLIAHRGPQLQRAADELGVGLAFEASVCAGVPVIASLRQFGADRVTSLQAILNGTCNFVLSRMARAGASLDEAIAEAQARGFAEPDPSADLTGRDSAEKLTILAREAGFVGIEPVDVQTAGLERVTSEDLRLAARSGKAIKLIAELTHDQSGLRLRVGPTLVDQRHPLASVDDEENAVVITSELAGTTTLRGKGAGARPTACAVIGDVLTVTRRGARPRAQHTPETALTHARLHRVRVDVAHASPGPVMERIGLLGLEARDVLVTRRGVCVDAVGCETDAEALCRELGEGLVAPVLEV